MALVRVFHLSGGFRLLVGLDLEEQRLVRRTMTTAALWSAAFIIALGVAGAWSYPPRPSPRRHQRDEPFIVEGD